MKVRGTALVAAPESNECFFIDFKEDGTYTIYKQKAVHRNDADDGGQGTAEYPQWLCKNSGVGDASPHGNPHPVPH